MSPTPDPDRRLIVTTMRDEGPFILEWLAYHLAIGFTDFLVFSNDCADGTDAILDRLDAMGVLTHQPNPRQGEKTVQWQALNRARDHALMQSAGWIMVSDVDEFLCIHPGAGRLDDLIAARPDARAFCIPWRMFGNDGRIALSQDMVIRQFIRCAPEHLVWPWRAVQFKTLFRNDGSYRRLGVHRPQGGSTEGWIDGNGDPLGPIPGPVSRAAGPRYGLAQINHYALGSAENFMIKCARGRPNRSEDAFSIGYWLERNFCDVEDKRILRWEGPVRARIADWLQDPQLAALSRSALDWRRARIAELLADPDRFALFQQLVMAGPSRTLPLGTQQQMLRLTPPGTPPP